MLRESRQKLLLGLVLCVIVISAPAAFGQWVACTPPGGNTNCTYAAAGIGTTSPGAKLHVSTTGNADGIALDGTTNPAMNLRNAGVVRAYLGLATMTGAYFVPARANDLVLRSETSRIFIGRGSQNPTLTVDGANLGVGTTAPQATLQVAGDLRIGSNATNKDVRIFSDVARWLNGVDYGQINAITPVTIPGSGTTRTALHLKNATAPGHGTNQIDLIVDGSITGAMVIGAVFQDLAEWVPSRDALEPGTVVVVDPDAMNGVLASSGEYQTTVAGVVSASPGVLLGVAGPSKEMIATTGRVKVRATASNGSIRAGDLLVTSDKAGVAMKSEPVNLGGVKMHRPGTLIGKALQSLESGESEILILLSLQ